jgi:hypothetical protein
MARPGEVNEVTAGGILRFLVADLGMGFTADQLYV